MSATHTNLNARWVALAYYFCLTVTFIILLLALSGIPARFNQLVGTADRRALLDLKVSVDFYAGYLTALQVLVVLTHIVIAGVIFWRRPDEGICLFVGLTLVTNSAVTSLSQMAGPNVVASVWTVLAKFVTFIGLASSATVLFIFPNGKFVPPFTRWLALLWGILVLVTVFAPQLPLSLARLPLLLQIAALFVVSGAGVYSLVHRYVRDSSAVHRQQIKWAVFGLSAAVLGPFVYFIPSVVLPSAQTALSSNFLYQRLGAGLFTMNVLAGMLSQTIFTFALLVFPLTFAIAILRFRLWDIDIIIRRTVTYSIVSALLVSVYFIGVVSLQQFFRVLIGQSTEPAIVVSTLAIALLSVPLRNRVQEGIDRRFYRRKYDAQKVLAEFAQSMRDETDLERLAERLVDVVQETMQPQSVSLWLKPTNPKVEIPTVVAEERRLH